jgi:hypothetical protein
MTMTNKLVAVFLITIGILSCNEDEKIHSDFTEEISPIVDTELPNNGEINKKVTFVINHGVYNGCGQYSRHETVTNGNDIFVTFFAKYPVNEICADIAPVRSTSYEFTPTLIGEYTFHFSQGGEEYLTDNIIVN